MTRTNLAHLLSLAIFVCFPEFALANGPLPTDDVAIQQKALRDAALYREGSITRGEKTFFDEQRGKCSTCHRVGERGGKVGPDLSFIGGKFDRTHLIESLLEPSAQIVEGFRSSTVLTAEGQVFVGIAKEKLDGSLTIVDVNGKSTTLQADEIESVKVGDVSLMPSGLTQGYTPDEFTDLVAYLESLRALKGSPGSNISGALAIPPEFESEFVVTRLSGAVAMEVLPDGRVLICEQQGKLRVIKDHRLLEQPMLSVNVDSTWERGLIGVTVARDFESQPWVYICYVSNEEFPHHRISRFRVNGDVAVPESEQILLRGDDQRKLGGKVPNGHQGGAMHFGPDGCLYVGIGEQTAGKPSQDLTTFQGKILRLQRDGSIPRDNPFLDQTDGKYQAIWCRGLRNPFTFAIHRQTGELLINDVGGNYEEINLGRAGANYGWPEEHGPTSTPDITGPIHIYPQASISGGDFLPETANHWPEQWRDRYFFADFVHGWIKVLHAAHPERADTFASGLRRPVDMRFSQDGSLYILLRNAWVIDGKFVEETGSLLRIKTK
jgi:putative heme-binding domain-containing protein